MPDHADSVKSLAKNYRTWATQSRSKGDEPMADRQERNAVNLDAILAELEELRRITKPIPASYGDLSDLPPELLKELTGIKVDELEQQLYNIVKSGGNEVDLDVILIELFRRHNIIQTRKFLQNKLWRMAQKGAIRSISGRKGVYSAAEPNQAPMPTKATGFADDLDDDVPF